VLAPPDGGYQYCTNDVIFTMTSEERSASALLLLQDRRSKLNARKSIIDRSNSWICDVTKEAWRPPARACDVQICFAVVGRRLAELVANSTTLARSLSLQSN